MDDQEFYRRYYAALERACMEASDGGTLLYGMLQNGDEAEAFLSRFEATAAKIAKSLFSIPFL